MAKSPLQQVKEQFETKAKLVESLKQLADESLWLGNTNETKGLERVSNAKLLKLHRTFTAVKAEFTTRQKLIDAVIELEKRAKDEGYKQKLATYPVPRLYDQWKSAKKRASKQAAAAK